MWRDDGVYHARADVAMDNTPCGVKVIECIDKRLPLKFPELRVST